MIAENISYAVVYIAEAFIAWLYFEYLFARKQELRGIAVVCGISYLFLFAIYFLNITVLNTISFFVVNTLLPCFLYHCAIKTAVLHSAFLSFIMTIAEVLIGLIMAFFVGDFSAYTYNISVMIPMAIMSKLLYLFLALVGARVFSPHKNKSEEPRMMVLFCSLPVLSACISVLVAYLSLRNEWNRSSGLIIVVSLLSLLVVNLIFFVLYNLQQKTNADYLSLQLSMQKEEADAAYYSAIQEQADSQRILIHDIKSHLQIIDGLAKAEKNDRISDYIAKLESELPPIKQIRLSKDPILNLILLRYADDCKKKQVEFICDIRENCSFFMVAPSKTTLYGNLLSNAIESAEVSTEKTVEVSVVHNLQQENLVISVINSCDTAPVLGRNGLFQTKKTGKGFHGIGLKGIERIVKKYSGVNTMYYDSEKKCFHHVIQFSIDQNNRT